MHSPAFSLVTTRSAASNADDAIGLTRSEQRPAFVWLLLAAFCPQPFTMVAKSPSHKLAAATSVLFNSVFLQQHGISQVLSRQVCIPSPPTQLASSQLLTSLSPRPGLSSGPLMGANMRVQAQRGLLQLVQHHLDSCLFLLVNKSSAPETPSG